MSKPDNDRELEDQDSTCVEALLCFGPYPPLQQGICQGVVPANGSLHSGILGRQLPFVGFVWTLPCHLC
jgi:hypothetical protein